MSYLIECCHAEPVEAYWASPRTILRQAQDDNAATGHGQES